MKFEYYIKQQDANINKENAKDYYYNLKTKLKEPHKKKKKNQNNINNENNEKFTDSSELNSTDNENYYIVEEDGKKIKVQKNINFGNHTNFSLYESLAIELVFQLFNYPEMGFFKYDFRFQKNEITDNIISWLDSVDNKETYLIDYLDKCINSKEKDEKNKIKINNDSDMINIYNKISDLIKKSSPDYIEKLTQNSKNPDKPDIEDTFSGDFDFIIPEINSELLQTIFNNKKISPFIFYGNIDVEKKADFDIIGEIKQGTDNYKKLHNQIKKYIEMISHFSNEKTNKLQEDEFHFNYKRKKILMYVFNGEYKNYLKIMTTFKINRKKFRNLKQFDGDDSFEKIKSKFNNLENTSHFLHLIIYSGFPFIFLYIPDIITINYLRNKDLYDIKSEFSKFKEVSQKTNEELLITKNELVKYKELSEQTSNELSITKKELLKYKDIAQKTNDELLKTKEVFQKQSEDFLKSKEDSDFKINLLLKEINELKARLDKYENPKKKNNQKNDGINSDVYEQNKESEKNSSSFINNSSNDINNQIFNNSSNDNNYAPNYINTSNNFSNIKTDNSSVNDNNK